MHSMTRWGTLSFDQEPARSLRHSSAGSRDEQPVRLRHDVGDIAHGWLRREFVGRLFDGRWIGGRIDITDAHVAEFLGERPKRQRRTPERAAHHGLI